MSPPTTPLYTVRHDEAGKEVALRIEGGCEKAPGGRPLVFFRADDIAVPSRNFSALIVCFQKHFLPLCLATVPAWLTEKRLAELRQLTGTGSSQWCWHQHGHVHRNFEPNGKKQEFGPARQPAELKKSIAHGQKRLAELLGPDVIPVFTPPWNRCGVAALQALVDLGFKAVSRSRGALPETVAELPDFQVNVDLHTRKEPSPGSSFAKLLTELEEGLSSGRCGIMIHHQRMNGPALELLDILLGHIKNNRTITPVHFGDLLKENNHD